MKHVYLALMNGRTYERHILDAIERIDKATGKRSRREWTSYVKRVFTQACPKGMQPYHTGARGPEYLVDLVWSDPSEKLKHVPWHKYRGLGLVLECEWKLGDDAFWEDFVKLADIRADARVFLGHQPHAHYCKFESDDGTQNLQIIQFLKHHRFFSTDDSLYVAMWSYAKGQPLVVRKYGSGSSTVVMRKR